MFLAMHGRKKEKDNLKKACAQRVLNRASPSQRFVTLLQLEEDDSKRQKSLITGNWVYMAEKRGHLV